jgi:hypothetical protein
MELIGSWQMDEFIFLFFTLSFFHAMEFIELQLLTMFSYYVLANYVSYFHQYYGQQSQSVSPGYYSFRRHNKASRIF